MFVFKSISPLPSIIQINFLIFFLIFDSLNIITSLKKQKVAVAAVLLHRKAELVRIHNGRVTIYHRDM